MTTEEYAKLTSKLVNDDTTKFNHYNGRYVNCYFWRTTQQQEIDFIEECDGTMTAFEMKWNPKKGNVHFPDSFMKSYDVKETVSVTPDNYLDWLR